MEQRMITIYCLIEEFLKGVIGKEEHVLSDTNIFNLSFTLALAMGIDGQFISNSHLNLV